MNDLITLTFWVCRNAVDFHMIMSSPPNSVGEVIMFLGCPFIRSDIVITISHERLSSFDKTDREYLLFSSPYWWPD